MGVSDIPFHPLSDVGLREGKACATLDFVVADMEYTRATRPSQDAAARQLSERARRTRVTGLSPHTW